MYDWQMSIFEFQTLNQYDTFDKYFLTDNKKESV